MSEITRRTANGWREFFSTAAAQEGIAWILEHRPKVVGDSMESAALSGKESAGFDRFKELIDEILNTDIARRAKPEESDELK